MARVVFLPNAEYRLRSEPGVRRDIGDRTERIARAANSGAGFEDDYRTSTMQGARRPEGRWRGSVITATVRAMRDNAKNHRLLRSIDAGRG